VVSEGRWSALAATLTLAILTVGQRLDTADFHVPFQYELDALLILPMVKSTVETGTHWRTHRLGAPGEQELHDFPVVDHLHFAVIWLLGRFFPDPVVVFNLYHVLTYPLTAITATFVLRRFGVSGPGAVLGGVLYALQPYHYLRGQLHYFLSAYYVVPLTLMVILWVCRGRWPFVRVAEGGRERFTLRTRDTFWAVLVGLLTASAGAYYAFFACALMVMAGLYGWAASGRWRAAASAGLVIGVIVVGGVANHAPTFPYQLRNGYNGRPHIRQAEDAERYGMKIAQLVLPVAGHNPVGGSQFLLLDPAAIRSMYQAPRFGERGLNESDWTPLGLIGTVGFLGLLFALLLPARKGWPVGPLAALTGFGTLLGTTGGFGAVFNYLISPQVRCYNRISIYLAFLALFAVVWVVDKLTAGRHRVRWAACAGLLVFGVWDQTNEQWFPDLRDPRAVSQTYPVTRAEVARQWRADAEFFARVEQHVPGGMVFNYPHVEFPEGQPYQESGSPGQIESYEHVLGYLHTQTVRWSFGAMKGREWDTWGRQASGRGTAVPDFLQRLVGVGFDGLLVDTRGLNPRWYAEYFVPGLEQALGRGGVRFTHPDRGLVFFSLKEYRQTLEQNSPAHLEAIARAEREKPLALWLYGFESYEPVGYEWRTRWCGRQGTLVLVNPTDRPVTLDARMKFRTTYNERAALAITGDVWADQLEIGPDAAPYRVTITLPPGRHRVGFTCRPLVNVLPSDSRNQLFVVLDFKWEEKR
jgi:hypothetical protein